MSLLHETQSHYDRNPFIEGGEGRVSWWRSYLRDFLPDDEVEGRLIADVGSSVGEIARGLSDRGGRVVCLDLSLESLSHCRKNVPGAPIFHGNALELPFADESFDHTISIGVLHHTPDCRAGFSEAARITAPGGSLVIFLYNYWNIYNLIYHAFAPVRKLVPLDRVPSPAVRLLQPFVRSHLNQELDEAQLRNLLGDKLWTPQATFHSVSEVRRWGREEGLHLVQVKKFYLGYANVMRFEKDGEMSSEPIPEVTLRCLDCGRAPMRHESGGWVCPACGRVYPVDDGIVRCLPNGAGRPPGAARKGGGADGPAVGGRIRSS